MELQGPWYRIPTTSTYIVEGEPTYIKEIDQHNEIFREIKLWVREAVVIFHKVKVADSGVEKVDHLLFDKNTRQVFIEKGNVPETLLLRREKYNKTSVGYKLTKTYFEKMLVKTDLYQIVQRLEHKQVASLAFYDYGYTIRQIIEYPGEKCVPYEKLRTVKFELHHNGKMILQGTAKECVEYVFVQLKL